MNLKLDVKLTDLLLMGGGGVNAGLALSKMKVLYKKSPLETLGALFRTSK